MGDSRPAGLCRDAGLPAEQAADRPPVSGAHLPAGAPAIRRLLDLVLILCPPHPPTHPSASQLSPAHLPPASCAPVPPLSFSLSLLLSGVAASGIIAGCRCLGWRPGTPRSSRAATSATAASSLCRDALAASSLCRDALAASSLCCDALAATTLRELPAESGAVPVHE